MLRKVALNLLRLYQVYISPWLISSCRFQPSCSEYMRQAILKYGLTCGILKGTIRLLRCHPFCGKGGDDPLR
ncbi:MAG: membrane protein insertion efficiency factor YidD [Candidatus Omnitrophica bacterium]|nr:membrane protein insertion efficiency factor YidD [Candidatus Omnitrophota bacterium]